MKKNTKIENKNVEKDVKQKREKAVEFLLKNKTFLEILISIMEKKGIKKGNSYSNNSVTWSGTEILNYFFSGNTTYESSKKVYHDTKTLYNIGKTVLYDVPKSIISPIYKLWRRFR